MNQVVKVRSGRLVRRAMIMLGTLVLALVAAEIGLRTYFRVRGRPYDADEANKAMRDAVASMARQNPAADDQDGDAATEDDHTILSPFVGFDAPVYLASLAHDRPNYALRSTSDRGGPYSILIAGGSVAGGFAVYGQDRLRELLLADPRFDGREIRFMNQGRGGYKQPQQMALLSFLFAAGFQFDAVIELDGFNEVALGYYNARHQSSPIYPSLTHWAHLTHDLAGDPEGIRLAANLWNLQERASGMQAFAERIGLAASCLGGEIALHRIGRIRKQYAVAYEAYGERVRGNAVRPELIGLGREKDRDAALRQCVRAWIESSRSMQAICQARGTFYLHVLQPTLHDPGSKPLTAEEIANSTCYPEWKEGSEVGYPLLRIGGEQLSAVGVNFLDASMVFRDVKEPLYYDLCHFKEDGNRLLAEFIAPVFLKTLP